jgi:hypothetical protein
MVGISLFENENKFVEYLRFQINRKFKSDYLIKNIPMFHAKLEDSNFKILKMIDHFEDVRRRDIYTLLVHEFNKIIEK